MRNNCDCGCIPPHDDPGMCSRNRDATRQMMQRRTDAALAGMIARADRYREEHQAGHAWQYGCPLCPLNRSSQS